MATYTTTGVIRPDIPARAFTKRELKDLEEAGICRENSEGDAAMLYLTFEDAINPDTETRVINILRRALRTLPEKQRYIEIEGAFGCSRMLDDGFGGFCTLITPTHTINGCTRSLLRDFHAAADLRKDVDVVLKLAMEALNGLPAGKDRKQRAASIARLKDWALERLGCP